MYAVTGASGKLGSAVAAALLKQVPAAAVRLGSRSPEKLERFRSTGAEVAPADFDDRESLTRLFAGRTVALVISSDAPNSPRVHQHKAAFEAARAAGVARIVYTSFTNASPDSRFLVAPSHVESEEMLRSQRTPYSILRNNLYAENIMIEAARATGELVQPGSAGRAAYITYADVARATVGAMLVADAESHLYEITGPEALSQFDIADRLSAAWARPVRVRDVTPGAYADALVRRGLPPFVIELLLSLHAAIAAGEFENTSPHAGMLAGGPIEPASDFLARA